MPTHYLLFASNFLNNNNLHRTDIKICAFMFLWGFWSSLFQMKQRHAAIFLYRESGRWWEANCRWEGNIRVRIKTGLKAKIPAGVSAAGWGAKAGVRDWMCCLRNSHSHCPSCKPPRRAAGRGSHGPRWHQPPPFPPLRRETTCTTTTVWGPTPAHALSHPSPCFARLGQIVQLTLPFSSLLRATCKGSSL